MGLDYRRERIATHYRISLDELLHEQRASDRAGRDDVPNDRLRLSMGRWELIGQRPLLGRQATSLGVRKNPNLEDTPYPREHINRLGDYLLDLQRLVPPLDPTIDFLFKSAA